ncbi:Eco57I restriction-modification methylase domain-containing protein [Methanothermococcus sp. SCGC AD-155-E23]|nr:Eco57I restriction-modification methylase domain-containing protein [Methanothermococcus sp. SCGC AD-155-E23]
MVKYNLDYLKRKGFFKRAIPLEDVEGVLVDQENMLAYVEVSSREEVERIRKKLLPLKVNYIWFYFPSTGKLKVFRRIGEIKWFYYSPNMRKDYRKSREDKLRKFSPDNMNILFDIRDIVEKFYWELWEHRILMAKSIRELKEDRNKLLVVQRFIDRLIFFYFLAQLKLIKIKSGGMEWVLDRRNTREFFQWICNQLNDKELQDFLNRIFFDVLGKTNERGFISEEFEVGGERFSILSPCLNGGLFIEEKFEGIPERKIRISGIKELILNVLNNYNWIIGEELPEEEDVVGDLTPEVIGHIYEKFVVSLEQIGLGKIKLEDIQTVRRELRYGRKKIGAYYTPEEITNYISMNTIYPYIRDKLGERFGSKGEALFDNLFNKEDFSREELEILKYLYFEVLTKLRICDNACGSGSFLIAAGDILLGLYTRVLKILEEHLGEDRDVKKILEEMEKSPTRNYYIVRQIIINNLYGVDLMEGAVEIAKLRFWLWLISQVDPKSIEGKRIETLPNLDYNLMVGNSLIGYVDIEDVDLDFIAHKTLDSWLGISKVEWLKNLAKKIREFKTLPSHEAVKLKEKLNRELEKGREFLNEKFYNMLKAKGVKISKEEFLNLKPFHWGFEFYEVFDLEKPKEERGFDIIIGNPPYVRQEKIKEIKPILSCLYETFEGRADIFVYFIERSIQTLHNNGYFSYIVSNKWLRAKYAKKLRKFLINNTVINQIVDFRGVKVFSDPTVDVCILVCKKSPVADNYKIFVAQPHSVEDLINNIKKIGFYLDVNTLKDAEIWSLYRPEILEIKEWIEDVGVPLKDLDVKIYRGITTGFNKAFIIDEETRKKLIEEDPKSEELIKPVLRGRDIGRYYVKWDRKWIICTFPALKIDIEKYPAIKEYLSSFGERLLQDGKPGHRKKTSNKWFETQDQIAYYPEFKKPKIIWQEIVRKPGFYFDNGYFYQEATCFLMTGKDVNKNLLLLLNSKPLGFIFKAFYSGGGLGDKTYRYKKYYLEKLPIRLPPTQQPFITLANYMLFLNATEERRKKERELIEFIDREIIDSLVYELYFKEKFHEDKLYPEPKEYLLYSISKYLKPIDYDLWAELYWKKELEGELDKEEENKMKELEEKNLETIREVVENIKKDREILRQIDRIKSHPWVKTVEEEDSS